MKKILTCDEFIKSTPLERQKYLDEIYGDTKPHKILAEIIEITPYYMKIKALYFLIHDEYPLPFEKIFPDEKLSIITKSGYLINERCQKENLNTGNLVIARLRLKDRTDTKGRAFTFLTNELSRDVATIESIYKKCNVTYDPKNIYEIRDTENKSLSAIIYGDFKEKLLRSSEKILEERDAEIKRRTDEINAEIAAKNAELQNIQEKILNAQRNLKNLNDNLQSIKNYYGVESEEVAEEKNSVEFHKETNFDEYISYWQNHLIECHGLSYRKEILESVYWGLHTDQLILLTGSPGTGKTSLVRALPECFGWDNAAIIPVQANWTDKSDLLGYYNPLEKNYMSTPFIDALLKFCRKAENSNDTFIICLDEMNLAHVEHYFAEFLSVLQSDRVIRLYSDELRRDIYRELKYNAVVNCAEDTKINFDEQRFMKMSFEERKYYLQLCRMANMFFKYPATFKIPTNIKFFGTLNQDATTLDISPKVIDRSFVIRVEKYDDNDFHISTTGHTLLLNFKQEFTDGYIVENSIIYGFDTFSFLNYIKPIVSINGRTRQNINILLNDYMIPFVDIPDVIIASFILPKIRLEADTDAEKIEALKSLCEDYPYSKEILEKYMTSPDGKEIDYWRA